MNPYGAYTNSSLVKCNYHPSDYSLGYPGTSIEEACVSKHNDGQLTLPQVYALLEQMDLAAENDFNWECHQARPSPLEFPAAVWRQLSSMTKLLLIANDYSFPSSLEAAYSGTQNYSYFQDDKGQQFVIDFSAHLQANEFLYVWFGQNLDTKEFLVFRELKEVSQDVSALEKLDSFRGIVSPSNQRWGNGAYIGMAFIK